MSSTKANIKDASVFMQLVDATNSFVSDCEDSVDKIDDYIFVMDNEMQKIKDLLAQRLYDAEIKLRNCDNDLTLCKARVCYDEEGRRQEPNCSTEKHNRWKAKRQVEVAWNNMRSMEELMRKADHLVNRFNESKKKFESLLQTRLQDGNDELKMLKRMVDDYRNSKLNL